MERTPFKKKKEIGVERIKCLNGRNTGYPDTNYQGLYHK